MAMNRGHEFEIKIAKAKDLPLSWFDLVLRPEKFKQHLKTLEHNPNSEPFIAAQYVTRTCTRPHDAYASSYTL